MFRASAYLALAAVLVAASAPEEACAEDDGSCEDADAELLRVELLQRSIATKKVPAEGSARNVPPLGLLDFLLGEGDFASAEELIPEKLHAAGVPLADFVPRFLSVETAAGVELTAEPLEADFPLRVRYAPSREDPWLQHAEQKQKLQYTLYQSDWLDTSDAEVAGALQAAANSNPLYKLFNGFDSDGGVASATSFLTSGRLFPAEMDTGAPLPRTPSAYDPDGRCPLQSNLARMKAAKEVGGPTLQLFQAQAQGRAWIWKDGEHRPINPSTDQELLTSRVLHMPFTPTWDRLSNALALFAMLPSFVLTDSGNRTTFFNNVAWSTCWNPAPFYYGPMIFKYSEVVPRLTNPGQLRGFFAATAPESTNFFGRNMIIFTDGENHRKYRRLLNAAGFARRYPLDLELVRQITAQDEDMESVVSATAPVLFKGLWGMAPPEDVMEFIQTYGKLGKFAIFGKGIDEILSPAGITQKIMDARMGLSEWAADTPFVQVLLAARAEFFPGEGFFHDAAELMQDISDLSAFAGLLGTTDMVQKCVQNQRRDPHHQELFREHPERYLIELMRLDSAVTSVTELLQRDEAFLLEGRNLTLGRDTPAQLVLATANRDPVHFKDPTHFELWRSNLGDSVAWNGRVQDVEARDEERAPRGCPGHCLSLKVGAAVCAKMMGSFEELLEAGKVGGEIRCNNFKHEAGKGDNAPLWQPPPGKTYPPPKATDTSLGEVLVRADAYCNAEHSYLGKFDSLADCTEAVEGAGGKYFYYGKGFVRGGWCYLAYTLSRDCPEGFKSGRYDFYDIRVIPDSQWLRCKVDLMKMNLFSMDTGEKVETGLLSKAEYTEPKSVTLASLVGKTKVFPFRTKVCRVEYRLRCLAETAKIARWEACCKPGPFSSSCEPKGKLELADSETAPEDDSVFWHLRKDNDDENFALDVSTDPPLPKIARPSLEAAVVSRSITLRQVFNKCPSWMKMALKAFGSLGAGSYEYYYKFVPNGARDHPIAKLLKKTPNSSIMNPTVFGTYTMGMVIAAIHLNLKSYSGSNLPPVDRINLPSMQAFSNTYAVFSFIGSPARDIDSSLEPMLSGSTGCVFDAFRKFPIEDDLDSGENEWWRILGSDYGNTPHQCPHNQPTCTKKEFILGVFANYTTEDGDPVYPRAQFDLRGLFRLGGNVWTDATERFFAFSHLGSHVVRVATERPSKGGESGVYVLETLDIAGLSKRAGFAVPGADMYFSRDGRPLMVRTPFAGDVWKHEVDEATWQYWKFHWRSSVYLRVTLIDHLYATHFAVAGMLAAASREALPPEHPLRRLLTLFTWGTVAVNDDAMHQLIGSRALLQRSTPFHNWQEVIEVASDSVPSLKERYGAFFGAGLASELAQVPYYQDGQLLVNALRPLVGNWTRLHAAEWCGPDGAVEDPHVQFFFKRLQRWTLDRHLSTDIEWLGLHDARGRITCSGLEKFLGVVSFGVTGYHRQVGQIGDIGADPDFASWSWRGGDASGIPRQHLQQALVVAFTAKIQPKINQDYSFLARGLAREAEATRILKAFRASMEAVAAEIDARNARRELPYYNMHPGQVECSVAV